MCPAPKSGWQIPLLTTGNSLQGMANKYIKEFLLVSFTQLQPRAKSQDIRYMCIHACRCLPKYASLIFFLLQKKKPTTMKKHRRNKSILHGYIQM